MSKVTGILRFVPLKGGGVTVTVDVPDGPETEATVAKLSGMFNKKVEIGLPEPQNDAQSAKTPLETAKDSLMTALDALSAISQEPPSLNLDDMSEEAKEILREKLNERALPFETTCDCNMDGFHCDERENCPDFQVDTSYCLKECLKKEVCDCGGKKEGA
jgi:hypothetical protein